MSAMATISARGLAGRIAGVPLVVETRHGFGSAEPRLRSEVRHSRIAHGTLTVCESDRAQLIEAGLAAARVEAVPNGIEPGRVIDRSPAAQGEIRLGFLGRLVEQKDPLFLVDVAAALKRRAEGRVSLHIAGEGPLRARLAAELAGTLPASDVEWLGEIANPASLFSRIDYLCLPSRWEGQPLAALEAMAAGVVVLARRQWSLTELLDGEPPAGCLIEPDADKWAAVIESLQLDHGRRRTMEHEAIRRAREDHSAQRMVERIETIYRLWFAGRGSGDTIHGAMNRVERERSGRGD